MASCLRTPGGRCLPCQVGWEDQVEGAQSCVWSPMVPCVVRLPVAGATRRPSEDPASYEFLSWQMSPPPRVGWRRAAMQMSGWNRPCLSLRTWQLPRATHSPRFPLKYAPGMPKETLPTHEALCALRGDCGLAAPPAPSCGALGSWGRGKPLLSCRLSSLGQYPAGSQLGEHTQYQEQFAHTFSLAPTIQCDGFVITPTLPLCKLRLGKETAPAQGPTARWC